MEAFQTIKETLQELSQEMQTSQELLQTTLQEISCENIRQNWALHRDTITPDHFQYELLWESLEKKMDLNPTCFYVTLFKKFINNQPIETNNELVRQNPNTLIFKGLGGETRKYIHQLCDKIGLHHDSKTKPGKGNKRHLYVYKPTEWKWEYTARNPYSKSDEYYAEQEKQTSYRRQKKEARLRNMECDGCGCNGVEADLFHSVYMHGIYCEDCLEIVSDGEGEPLSCHKFEPI